MLRQRGGSRLKVMFKRALHLVVLNGSYVDSAPVEPITKAGHLSVAIVSPSLGGL